MDATWFLKQRTKFIRFYFDECIGAFTARQATIERHEPPFADSVPDESGEPPHLAEWMEGRSGIDMTALTCVSLLSDALKLYFVSLQHRVIGFEFRGTQVELRGLWKPGFLATYKGVLAQILQTDWSDCPVDFAIIEQVVLARNRAQHGSDLTSLRVTHDRHTLQKYPRPFFASDEEMQSWVAEDGEQSYLFAPAIEITRENLFEAIAQTEALAEWIDGRGEKIWEWRMAGRE